MGIGAVGIDYYSYISSAEAGKSSKEESLMKSKQTDSFQDILTNKGSETKQEMLGRYRDNVLGFTAEIYETDKGNSVYSVKIEYNDGKVETKEIDADSIDAANCNSIDLFVRLKHLEKNGKCDNAFMNHILARVYMDYRTPDATADTNINFRGWFEQQLELEKSQGFWNASSKLEKLLMYL